MGSSAVERVSKDEVENASTRQRAWRAAAVSHAVGYLRHFVAVILQALVDLSLR